MEYEMMYFIFTMTINNFLIDLIDLFLFIKFFS